jgi:hypothetical protein
VKKLLVLIALVAACKKDEPKPEPAAEPAAPPAEPEAKPAIDAPEPAGAAAARIAPDVASEKVDKGKAAIGNLKKGLLGALTKALEGGAAGAVETCSVEAPKLAAAQEGVAVGRMTRRTRNPANAVAGWQEEALAHFEGLVAAGATLDGAVFARTLDSGKVGYAEPLVVADLCLVCHGDAVAPEVTSVLAAKYPDDRATGYHVGDLRGLAWAEVP